MVTDNARWVVQVNFCMGLAAAAWAVILFQIFRHTNFTESGRTIKTTLILCITTYFTSERLRRLQAAKLPSCSQTAGFDCPSGWPSDAALPVALPVAVFGSPYERRADLEVPDQGKR